MALDLQVLGKPGRDNALWLRVDTGQSITRLLFDCGDGCLDELPLGEIHDCDHLLFSHLHMDHVAGFDQFFRANYNRDRKANHLWGPPQTAQAMHHRFQGYWWNLHAGQPGTWRVHDIFPDQVTTVRCEIAEAFAHAHGEDSRPHTGTILETEDFAIHALQLDHHGPCLAYRVDEKARQNVDTARLESLGLTPGPWLKALKDGQQGSVEIAGQQHDYDALREALLVETLGDSVAYLTDFRLDAEATSRLVAWLEGCGTVVCEAQYRHEDLALAERHAHMTTRQVGELAAQAGIHSLILFHLSDRYQVTEWSQMLTECQAYFPQAQFPEHWQMNP